MNSRPVIAQPVIILFIFALGTAAAVFGAIASDNVDFARARLTVWTCLALGAWATAIVIARAPHLQDTSWARWWIAGLIAYLVHLWFGFGVIFEWSLGAVFQSQTALVAGANFALLALWLVSAVIAAVKRGPLWLHLATTALFAAAALISTLSLWDTPAFYGGLLIAALWLAALYYRFVLARRSAQEKHQEA
ncbi:MAG: hypothetical protein GKS02_07305 [Alphaproteobacteria bacterium]|nr:hypothetical protein [Alphaproteobacteria bacterium]